jgi:hypothetical protein
MISNGTTSGPDGTLAPLQMRLLLGQPSIHDFIAFARTKAIDGHRLDELTLTKEWQAANSKLRELATHDASNIEISNLAPLPSGTDRYANSLLSDPPLAGVSDYLPCSWAMVDLDRMLVWQKHVDSSYADRMRQSFPNNGSLEDLVRLAVGLDQPKTPVGLDALSKTSFAFTSASTDIRVLGAAPLRTSGPVDFNPHGHVMAAVAIYIGYSVNVMWAIHVGKRLLLINGTSRCYALLRAGRTRVPCLVTRISHRDDLDLVGLPESSDSVMSMIQRPRPPMLKDFLDEKLSKPIDVASMQHVIRLQLNFDRLRISH